MADTKRRSKRLRGNVASNSNTAKKQRTKELSMDESWLIPFMDQIYDKIRDYKEIELPKIVVVGDQSSGKSSLVEALVGIRGLLPQGDGFVTKRALRIQLLHSPAQTDASYLFGKEVIPSLDELKELIARNNTEDLADTAMVITIASPNVSNLTLVDTPGIVNNINKDTQHHLVQHFKDIVLREISSERIKPIVLFVYKAGADINLSTAHGVIEHFYEHSIGVLTHVDRPVSNNKSIEEIVDEFFPTQYGKYLVMNNERLLGACTEVHWFAKSDVPRHLREICGVHVLRQRCTELLQDAIKASIPVLREKILADIQKWKKELMTLGFHDERFPSHTYEIETKRFIVQGYKKVIKSAICQKKEASPFCKELKVIWKELGDALDNQALPSRCNFNDYEDARKGLSELAIQDCIAKTFIKQLKPCLLATCEKVFHLLEKLVGAIEIPQYQRLRKYLQEKALAGILSCHTQTITLLSTLIAQEYINFAHLESLPSSDGSSWNFFGNSGKKMGVLERAQAYCNLVRNQMKDQATKIIWFHLIKASYKELEQLRLQVPSQDTLQTLLQEPRTIQIQRNSLQIKIKNLEQVLNMLQEYLVMRTGRDIIDIS